MPIMPITVSVSSAQGVLNLDRQQTYKVSESVAVLHKHSDGSNGTDRLSESLYLTTHAGLFFLAGFEDKTMG